MPIVNANCYAAHSFTVVSIDEDGCARGLVTVDYWALAERVLVGDTAAANDYVALAATGFSCSAR